MVVRVEQGSVADVTRVSVAVATYIMQVKANGSCLTASTPNKRSDLVSGFQHGITAGTRFHTSETKSISLCAGNHSGRESGGC